MKNGKEVLKQYEVVQDNLHTFLSLGNQLGFKLRFVEF